MRLQISSQKSLDQFDRLVSKGELQWIPSTPIIVEDDGFQFQIRICPGLLELKPKPSVQDTSLEHTKSSPRNNKGQTLPFSDPDPDFHVATIQPHHKLILNKYCTLRPQYLLCSTLPNDIQSSYLSADDFQAAWQTLRAFDDPHMILFGAGESAGTSMAHKHLQVFPRVQLETNFKPFPDLVYGSSISNLPFHCYLSHRIPSASCSDLVAAKQLKATYDELINAALKISGLAELDAVLSHNLILVDEWIFLIPRTRAKYGRASTGAKGMVGMIWLYDEEEFAAWKEIGFLNVLTNLGFRK